MPRRLVVSTGEYILAGCNKCLLPVPAAFRFAGCPLSDHVFNRSKSNLKVLEYGSNSVVPVCSEAEPYLGIRQGETGFSVKDGDWKHAIESVTPAMAKNCFEFVRDEFSWQSSKIRETWRQAFLELAYPAVKIIRGKKKPESA
jgi:hypothetical protein